ncbi:ATP-binding protein [Poriferisphaera sp. WC338]|uniref:DNA polymerase III subunit n=1 Tax=Poriferisphaera sp. WC338 TaxID=3425129 RepID=UPI003D816F7F
MEDVIGQSRAVGVLKSALNSGKLHHAYVFHGPAGVGKFRTAVGLAKVFLCQDQVTNLHGEVESCGGCASCKMIEPLLAVGEVKRLVVTGKKKDTIDDEEGLRSGHPDLRVVVKELARYSDDANVRKRKLTVIPREVLMDEVVKPAGLAPKLGHGKVFIIDEAELMADAGQNALLKTLEEPPAGSLFILITSSEDRLLPTIKSRCQRIAFAGLDDQQVEGWLGRHASESMRELDEVVRRWLLQFAGGSLGKAVMAIEYGLTEWAKEILPRIDGIAAGEASGELGKVMSDCIDGFAKAWVDSHDGASKLAANKRAAGLMWSMIAEHARHRIGACAIQTQGMDEEAAEGVVGPWLKMVDAIPEAEAMFATNVKLDLVCDHLVMKMTQAIYKADARA